MSPTKRAEPIDMSFGLRTRLSPSNHVLDGVQIPYGKGQVLWGKGRPIVKYRNTLLSSVQKRLNQSRCHLGCGLGWAQGIVLDGDQIPMGMGNFGERAPIVKYRDFLP